MVINSQTKISVIIKHNSKAIDVIASINPHFNKLRNPVLRAVLAPRVTIQEAAKIGKCEVSTMLEKLSTIGFIIEDVALKNKEPESMNNKNIILQLIQSGKIKSLDVRPSLAKGVDPFSLIMGALKEVPDDYVLEIINSFEPTPLINILEKRGYSSFVETNNGEVKTYFTKVALSPENNVQTEKIFTVPKNEFEKIKEIYKDNFIEIDVRDLEMPLPMVTILSEVEKLKEGQALFVHHKKIPQLLLPELKDRNLKVWITEIEEGNVKLLIHK